ncbi:MAG: type II toxin-antitoxin system HicA family toxin [Ignavibacteriales bacterium]|nr:type II toxin-antitoxin system HicA family toxin [Ignavibacteriales bacterium]
MKQLGEILESLRKRKYTIRFRELKKILEQNGFEHRQSGKGTSHHVFSHPKLLQNVVLVSHGKNDTLKIYQVNDALKALEELKELQ